MCLRQWVRSEVIFDIYILYLPEQMFGQSFGHDLLKRFDVDLEHVDLAVLFRDFLESSVGIDAGYRDVVASCQSDWN
jgi:hypothetical protein